MHDHLRNRSTFLIIFVLVCFNLASSHISEVIYLF